MNFLAHLVLSSHDAELQIGNLLGDFVKGRPPETYSEGIRRGIVLHRRIDQVTDMHPAVKHLQTLLSLRHGRYAGVVVDVLFDHYLARDWSNLLTIEYGDFALQTYSNIKANLSAMPPKLATRFSAMVDSRWLDVYKTVPGILEVFERMQPRIKNPEYFQDFGLTISEFDEELSAGFAHLFPDLREAVIQFCAED
ncbi:MAG: ACP phosphodiesterase [Bacteroidota bacterium]